MKYKGIQIDYSQFRDELDLHGYSKEQVLKMWEELRPKIDPTKENPIIDMTKDQEQILNEVGRAETEGKEIYFETGKYPKEILQELKDCYEALEIYKDFIK